MNTCDNIPTSHPLYPVLLELCEFTKYLSSKTNEFTTNVANKVKGIFNFATKEKKYNTVDLRNYVLDSIPELKNLYINNFNENTYVHLDTVFILGGEDKITPKFPITIDQLSSVFKNTNKERLAEVVKAINKYSNKFEINSVERMSHFLGHIGAETGGLKDLTEGQTYKPRRVVEIFGYVKYADLFQGYNSDPTKCIGVTYEADGGTLGDGRPGKVSPNFPYKNRSEVIIAYSFPTKGVTLDNIKDKVDEYYNSGKLKVKSKYYGKKAKVFDVTYACRMGNRGPSSGDGSTYKGIGFIHLTGRWQYKQISKKWNNDPENKNNKKYFHIPIKDGGNMEDLMTNVDVAMKASMYYWESKGINDFITKGKYIEDDVRKVGGVVNLGSIPKKGDEDKIKAYNKRLDYTKNIYNNLKQKK